PVRAPGIRIGRGSLPSGGSAFFTSAGGGAAGSTGGGTKSVDGGAGTLPLAGTTSLLGSSTGGGTSETSFAAGSLSGGGAMGGSGIPGGEVCAWAALPSRQRQTATTPNRHNSPPSTIQPYRDRGFTSLLLSWESAAA